MNRPWLQLSIGILAMIAIANLQYGWTLFVDPLHQKFGWTKAAIQVAFTLFVLTETWPVPLDGYLIDRFGPRPMLLLGGVLVGISWVGNAYADTLVWLYANSIVGGIGAGIVYGASIGNALKWFPHRRGLAAGLTSAAFGAGSALTVLPISNMIRDDGFQTAFFWFGLVQGAVILVCAFGMRPPTLAAAGEPSATSSPISTDFSWSEMIRTPLFWLLYVMFVMVAMGGLMVAAQIGTMARSFGVADAPIAIFGSTIAALPLALSLDRILNGLTRPFFGWISDHWGRENTMFIAFTLEGFAIMLLLNYAHIPIMFVLLTGLTFFAWGEIYSLFPALCTDVFGRKFAATNYGLLYTAKGTASLMVPIGSLVQEHYGSWQPVLQIAIAFDLITAFLALLVLKPMASRFIAARSRV